MNVQCDACGKTIPESKSHLGHDCDYCDECYESAKKSQDEITLTEKWEEFRKKRWPDRHEEWSLHWKEVAIMFAAFVTPVERVQPEPVPSTSVEPQVEPTITFDSGNCRCDCNPYCDCPCHDDRVAADSVSHPPRAHESGWLIEKAKLGLCLGVSGQRFSWVVFTNDDAIRFARKRDAEAVLNALTFESRLGREFGGVVITEHIWG